MVILRDTATKAVFVQDANNLKIKACLLFSNATHASICLIKLDKSLNHRVSDDKSHGTFVPQAR